MPRTRLATWPCPIARATDLLGDRWTPLVLRQAFQGQRRFDEMQRSLGIPRAQLSDRLSRLVEDGLLVAVPYQESPVRHEYRLTPKGRAAWDVLAAMWRWGSDWTFDGEPPVVLADRETNDEVVPLVVDERTGAPLDVRAVRMRRNPRFEVQA